MATLVLRQGDVTAKLSSACYHPAEGFEADNTWHVAEEYISADSDTKLTDGPAMIQHDGTEFSVSVTVLDSEMLPDEDEEPEWAEPACTIEIGYAEGLPKLARAISLL